MKGRDDSRDWKGTDEDRTELKRNRWEQSRGRDKDRRAKAATQEMCKRNRQKDGLDHLFKQGSFAFWCRQIGIGEVIQISIFNDSLMGTTYQSKYS